MKLTAVRVQHYKSVLDSTSFTVGDVTCLLGKNEAGKTALLESLYRLNPDVAEDGNFSAFEEYPRAFYSDYDEQRQQGRPEQPVLITEWELSPADIGAAEAVLGAGALASNRVTVSKGYDNVLHWDAEISEPHIIEELAAGAELPKREEALRTSSSIEELVRQLEELRSPSPNAAALLQRIQELFPGHDLMVGVGSVLRGRLPIFMYFAEYEKLPGQISLTEFLKRKQAKQLRRSDRLFEALLLLAGTSPEEMKDIGQFDRFIAKIEAVSNRLSREIFSYWRQNQHLGIQFRLDAARPQDPTPFNEGWVFRTRIENQRHRVSVGFDERSTGFIWFFSFLVWFSQLRREYGDGLIILMDEPGLSLHPHAQADLLRFVADKLRPHFQVLYSTHSPFMVDRDHLDGIRTVEDVVTKRGDILGTKVGTRVLATDADTILPLQAVLGFGLTEQLFAGRPVLLLERPAEVLYLQWFANLLRGEGKEALDVRWVLMPVGGPEVMHTFAAVFAARQTDVAALVERRADQRDPVGALMQSKLLRAGSVFTFGAFCDRPECGIEDMLGRDLFVDQAARGYKLRGAPFPPREAQGGAPVRLLDEVRAHFEALFDEAPFDDLKPALHLAASGDTATRELPGIDEAKLRFSNLFRALNARLAEQ